MPPDSRHDLEQTISHIEAQILSQKQVITEEVNNAGKVDDNLKVSTAALHVLPYVQPYVLPYLQPYVLPYLQPCFP